MPRKSLSTEQILTLLAETPQRVDAATTGLRATLLRTSVNHNEWSANEVLAHLRACADVWGGCIAAILAEERPTLRAVNPRTWIEQTDYRELEFRPSLRAFVTQRADLLTFLESLSPENWSRAATVTGAGKVLERSVLSYAQWLAEHERAHVKQIERIINSLPAEQPQPKPRHNIQ
jgi:hypothetical protein